MNIYISYHEREREGGVTEIDTRERETERKRQTCLHLVLLTMSKVSQLNAHVHLS